MHVAIIYVDEHLSQFSSKSEMVTREALGELAWNDPIQIYHIKTFTMIFKIMLKDKYPYFEVGLKCIIMVF